jgi:hypothetical protein
MTPVEAVIAERRRRGWSIREAARIGGTSNQTWGLYERTGDMSNAMRRAIPQAFGWSTGWETDPPAPTATLTTLTVEIAELRAQVTALAEVVEGLLRRAGDERDAGAASHAPPNSASRKRHRPMISANLRSSSLTVIRTHSRRGARRFDYGAGPDTTKDDR